MSPTPACCSALVTCDWLVVTIVRRSSTLCIGPLNRFGPPSVRTATSRVWALATPWAAAAVTSAPRIVVANIFPRAKRTTLTCLIIRLLALSGDRCGLVQERDHARYRRETRMFLRHVPISSSHGREEGTT